MLMKQIPGKKIPSFNNRPFMGRRSIIFFLFSSLPDGSEIFKELAFLGANSFLFISDIFFWNKLVV